MSTKKVQINSKPINKNKPAPVAADAWVESREAGGKGMKRLTIDVPESLHRRIKSQCAIRGKKIVDEVRELLAQKYGK